MIQEMRLAVRTLLRTPGFTVVAVLTLALGIGASTAIFSVVEGVLLRPLPYPEPERIVRVFQVNDEGGRTPFSHPNLEDVRARNRSFTGLAQYAAGVMPVTVGQELSMAGFAMVSGEFFDVVGIHPVLGRGFTPEEASGSGASVAVVSHEFWQGVLGGGRDLSSLTLRLQSGTVSVVGVLPPGFTFPDNADVDVIAPYMERQDPSRTAHNWKVLGRLRGDVTLAQARQDLSAIARQLKAEYGDDTWMVGAAVVPLHEQLVGNVRPALLVLLAASAVLLLIACANVVNLLLSRMAMRQRELAVRLALGAGTGRLVRQFIAEALVLSLAGGAVGVLLAAWGVAALLALEPGQLPRLEGIGVNATVLGYALGVSILTATSLGLLLAWRATRADVRNTLASSQRTMAGGASSRRIRTAVVVAEVAMTIVLLAGAGLLVRSFERLLSVDPGFRTEGAVLMEAMLPGGQDPQFAARNARFLDGLIERIRAVPGVERVGLTNAPPLSGRGANGMFLILDRPDEVQNFEDWRRIAENPDRTGYAEYRIASADYFQAMGIPLVAGRLFDERDHADAPHVAVISESLARTRWPGEDPIGKIIQFGNMDGDLRAMMIIGVVGDVRHESLEAEPSPTFYGNVLQRPIMGQVSVVITGPGARAAIGPARTAAHSLDPTVPVGFQTIEEAFSDSLAERRFSMLLLGIFALVALIVAAAGLYGVVSYLVAQRTREIGIRIAVGAGPESVMRMVVGQGAALAALGVACGIFAALALTRFLSGMVYGVATTDPITFVGVATVLLAVAALASWVPARRAVRLDPMVALREE
ncbi:MAG TPA: ABC transporter permease [Longimicrobiales bacterium]|nr:ABC transporter permease [Longimicrobiales bacterium]